MQDARVFRGEMLPVQIQKMKETSSVSASMLTAMIVLRVSIRDRACLKAGLGISRCGTVFRTIRTFPSSESREVPREKSRETLFQQNRAKRLGCDLVSLSRGGGMVMVEIQVRCCPQSLSHFMYDFCLISLVPCQHSLAPYPPYDRNRDDEQNNPLVIKGQRLFPPCERFSAFQLYVFPRSTGKKQKKILEHTEWNPRNYHNKPFLYVVLLSRAESAYVALSRRRNLG
jgi:hypothetical protein